MKSTRKPIPPVANLNERGAITTAKLRSSTFVTAKKKYLANLDPRVYYEEKITLFDNSEQKNRIRANFSPPVFPSSKISPKPAISWHTSASSGKTTVDFTEYRYSAYGELLEASGSGVDECDLHFSTKYWDAESGLYWYGYRYYSPELGRWMSRDPLGYVDGLGLHEAFGGNPGNAVDPDGLSPDLDEILEQRAAEVLGFNNKDFFLGAKSFPEFEQRSHLMERVKHEMMRGMLNADAAKAKVMAKEGGLLVGGFTPMWPWVQSLEIAEALTKSFFNEEVRGSLYYDDTQDLGLMTLGALTLEESTPKLSPICQKINLALGRQKSGKTLFADIEKFALAVGAVDFTNEKWKTLGLYPASVKGWGEAFPQAMDAALATGGKIHFDLSDLKIAKALAGDPDIWVGRYTAWELQQVVRNPDWFINTLFYRPGPIVPNMEIRIISRKRLIKLGIKLAK